MFALENTEGFTQEILDKMNADRKLAIAALDKVAIDYDDKMNADRKLAIAALDKVAIEVLLRMDKLIRNV